MTPGALPVCAASGWIRGEEQLMVEAELKARVHDPESITQQLDGRATARFEVYRDTYYDRPDGSWTRSARSCASGRCIESLAVVAPSGDEAEHRVERMPRHSQHPRRRPLRESWSRVAGLKVTSSISA